MSRNQRCLISIPYSPRPRQYRPIALAQILTEAQPKSIQPVQYMAGIAEAEVNKMLIQAEEDNF